MNASAKGTLRETRTTRHRCGFATSVDCVSKRPKRAQQPRLQEHMLQLKKQGEWRDGVVRVVPTVHLPESMINITASPKNLAEGIGCGRIKRAASKSNEDPQAKKSHQGCKK